MGTCGEERGTADEAALLTARKDGAEKADDVSLLVDDVTGAMGSSANSGCCSVGWEEDSRPAAEVLIRFGEEFSACFVEP